MTLRQLKAFLAVAQTLNFSEASQRMYMSQPALSLAIKGLEESLGGRLIVRTTRTVNLTPEGQTLYEKGRRLVQDLEALEKEMRQRFRLQTGVVSIATMPSFAANVLPDIISRFRQAYADVAVQIHDVIAEETVDMVRTGKVELGVSFRPSTLLDSDDFTPLYQDEFVALIPHDNPLTNAAKVSWKELLAFDFIGLQHPSMVRTLIENTLSVAGIPLNVTFESHQLATVGRMVSNGLGVSVVPSLCSEQMRELGAALVPIHSPTVTSQLGILTKHKHSLSMPAKAMFDVVSDYYQV